MQFDVAVCTKAMSIYSALVAKATQSHAGHVIEQEEGSCSVAFYRAVDAVAFCRQVRVSPLFLGCFFWYIAFCFLAAIWEGKSLRVLCDCKLDLCLLVCWIWYAAGFSPAGAS